LVDKSKRVKHHEENQDFNMEISTMLLCPWICYLIAEGTELSGIVAILTNGIVLNYYATPNITVASRKVTKIAVDTIAYVTETMVFLFLGIGMIAFDHPYEDMGAGSMLTTVVNLNIARFLNIFIVTWTVNRSRSEETRITSK
jgi:solute carrier family 9 (sodium/hydrogen exchanger), member 8